MRPSSPSAERWAELVAAAWSRPSLLLLVLSYAFHSLALTLVVHLPGWLVEHDLSLFGVGVVMSVAPLAALLLRPAQGWLIDRVGCRPTLVAAGVVHVLVTCLYLFGSHRGWLMAARLAHGVSEAAYYAAFVTLVFDLAPPSKRTAWLGGLGVAGLLPFAIGPSLGDAIEAVGGHRAVLWLMLTCAVFGLAFSLYLPVGPPHSTRPRQRQGAWRSLLNIEYMRSWAAGALLMTALSCTFVFLKPFVQMHDLPAVGLFFTPYGLASAGIRLLGWFRPQLYSVGILRVALLFVSLGLGSLAWSATTSSLIVSGILCGLGYGLALPQLLVACSASGTRTRGLGVSVFCSIFELGLVLGALIFGGLAQAFGSMQAEVFLVAAGIAVLAQALLPLRDSAPQCVNQ